MPVLTLTLCVALPATASAHALLLRADPSPGARLRAAPAEIALTFSEPLNRDLSTARIIYVRSQQRVPATVTFTEPTVIVLRLAQRLSRGAYLVRWHSVSVLDGHTVNGSFGFAFGLASVPRTQQSVTTLGLAGILHAGLRALGYAALFFFGGGVLCGLLLRSELGPAGWLLPSDAPGCPEIVDTRSVEAIWWRTTTAGWLAAVAGAAVALADAASAAGGLHWHGIESYLFSTAAGGARLLTVLMILVAVVAADRWLSLAALALLAALLALAFGGHANSASPRALALTADWLHLSAAVVWAGGIAQIAATWLPGLWRSAESERRRVMREVLTRFGRLALAAFAIVAIAGATLAVTELRTVQRLWSSSYGTALLIKIGVVALMAAASWTHALRLRPRLLRATAAPFGTAERRHWRLLGIEPPLTAVVLGVGGLLAVLPLPADDVLAAAKASRPAAAYPAIDPPDGSQLAVAEQAGRWVAAAWVNRPAGTTAGTLWLLDSTARPVAARVTIQGAQTTSCGAGCRRFRFAGDVGSLRLRAVLGDQRATASLPVYWLPGDNSAAQRILAGAVRALDHLRSFRIAERLVTGFPGPPATASYWISGPHDYRVSYGGQTFGQTIALGTRTWVLEPGGHWQEQSGPPLDTLSLMPWFEHQTDVRLLDVTVRGGQRIADLALADIRPVNIEVPLWFRLRIDLRSDRVLAMRMIAPAHFMNQRYYRFDTPVAIAAPPR